MRNFQDTFEIREQSFISTFSISMTVPLIAKMLSNFKQFEHIVLIAYLAFQGIYRMLLSNIHLVSWENISKGV